MAFDDTRNEYVIEDMFPRRPLINYLWSDYVMQSVDQFGCGKSLACIGTLRRPMTDGEKLVYIKENGAFYAANRNFRREPFDRFYTVVGLGYHRVVSEYKGLRTEVTLTVPQKGYAECTNISVCNLTDTARTFDLYFYCKPFVNTTPHTSYSRAGYSDVYGGLLYTHNGYKLDHPYNTVFVKADTEIAAYAVTDGAFLGKYDKSDDPQGVRESKLCSEGATFDDDFCAALQFSVRLAAGETKDINIAVALGQDEETAVSAATTADIRAAPAMLAAPDIRVEPPLRSTPLPHSPLRPRTRGQARITPARPSVPSARPSPSEVPPNSAGTATNRNSDRIDEPSSLITAISRF